MQKAMRRPLMAVPALRPAANVRFAPKGCLCDNVWISEIESEGQCVSHRHVWRPMQDGAVSRSRKRQAKDEEASQDWVAAALAELARGRGIDNVRVEVLAERLGVTKGGFYRR